MRKLYFILLTISFLLNIKNLFSQAQSCFSLNYSPACVQQGQNVTISVDGYSGSSLWTITQPNGAPFFPPTGPFGPNITIPNIIAGSWTITVQPVSPPLPSPCSFVSETFTIDVLAANQNLTVSNNILNSLCENEEINLLNDTITQINNITALPITYFYSIGGIPITNPSEFYVPNTSTTIDVYVVDGTNCISNTASITILNPTPNNIVAPNYIIQDTSGFNVIQACATNTQIEFNIANPDSLFSYSWIIDNGNPIAAIPGPIFQNFDGTNYSNPDEIPIRLIVYDSLTGCKLPFDTTIAVRGMGNLATSDIANNNKPICVEEETMTWIESNDVPITNFGPGDSIQWIVYCGSGDTLTNSLGLDSIISGIIINVTWGMDNLPSAEQVTTNDNGVITTKTVYPFTLEPNITSCDCDYTGTDDNYDGTFKIEAIVTSACNNGVSYPPLTVGKLVSGPLEPKFNVISGCVGESTTIMNNSEIGCDGTTFDTNEDTISYYWNFGDCYDTTIIIDVNTATDPFPDVTHVYEKPGVYWVKLRTESYCGTDSLLIQTVIRPQPLVNTTANDTCFGLPVLFQSNAIQDTTTNRIDSCDDGSTVSIDTIYPGASISSFTYLWSMIEPLDGEYIDGTSQIHPNPKFIFNSCGPKTVWVEVNDSNDCPVVDTVNLTIYENPVANFSTDLNVCNGNCTQIIDSSYILQTNCVSHPISEWEINISSSINGISTFSQLYTTSPNICEIINVSCQDPNILENNFNVLLKITDSFGCQDTSSKTTTITCQPIADFSCDSICIIEPQNGQITFTNNSSFYNTSTTTWSWDFGDGNQSNSANPTHTYLNAGTYKVILTLSDGSCTDTKEAWINVYENPSITNFVNVNVSCFGGNNGSSQVLVNGGDPSYNFNWFPIGFTGQGDSLYSSLSAGDYSVIVTDNNGCTDSSVTTIIEPTQINISTSFTEPSCHGGNNGSISLNVSGATAPYQYSIDGGNTWQTSNTFNALAAGTYTIQIEDANGCNYSTSETITQPTQINITTSFNEPSCFGFSDGAISLNVSGATAPYQYSIDGGITWQTSNTFNALAAGTYTIQIEDNNGCSYSASETITQPTVLVVSQGNVTNASCFNMADGSLSVNVLGGTSPYQYSIDGGNTWQTSNTFNNLLGGVNYNILIEDDNGCIDNISIFISQPTIGVSSNANTVNTLCFGDSTGIITISASGGTIPYQYSIDGGITWQNSNTFNGLAAGTYTVITQDLNNCSQNINVNVNEPNQVNISTSFTEPSCHGGSNGSISLNVSGATAPFIYAINNNWQTSNTFNALAAGTYTIQIEDANGCNYSTSETITQPTQINITTSFNEPSCFGFSDGAISLNVSGATAPYQYSIDGGNTWQTSNTFNALVAGTYTIQIEDDNGCSYSASETITQPTVLVVSQGNVTNVSCFGGNDGSLSVNASGATAPYQYSIDGGNTWQTSNTFNTLTAGTYTIDIKDNNNCSDNVNITITEPTILVVSQATITNVSCFGGNDGSLSVNVSGATAPYQYSIDGGITWQNSNTFNTLTAGTYTIDIKDNNNCSDNINITITEPNQVNISTSFTEPSCHGGSNGSISLNVSGATAPYQYSIDGGNTWQTSNTFNALADWYIHNTNRRC